MGHGWLERVRFGDIEKQRLKTCISCYVSCSGDPKDSFQSWTCLRCEFADLSTAWGVKGNLRSAGPPFSISAVYT